MNDASYEKMYIDHHNGRAAAKGMTPEALWGSQRSQQVRFRVIEQVFLSREAFSVLDVGCGLGDFYPHLRAAGYGNVSYTGLDLNARFVEEASRRHPDARFVCGKLSDLDGEAAQPASFDYIVASGIYNLGDDAALTRRRILDDYRWIKARVRIGFAVNFLSTRADSRDAMSLYYDASAMFAEFTEHFGRFCRLYHDYLPHDFTMIAHTRQLEPWK